MNADANQLPLRARIQADVLAGVTVALVGLPQCLAYALMSGLPPAYGLVTAAIPGLVAAVFGKSAQVVSGPTNTTGLLILAALGPYLGANGLLAESGLHVMATLALLAGALRLLIAFGGGTALLRYLPESVLVGFTIGAGILIAAMQLDEALGLPPIKGGNLPGEIGALVSHFQLGVGPAWPSVVCTVATAAALLLGKRLLPRFPVALVAVAAATLAGYFLKLDSASGLPLVLDRSPIPRGWPPMAPPVWDFELLRSLLLPAAAITLLGTLELAVSAKAQGAKPDMRREIAAQGAANVAGAFTGSFPASASLTRSALLKLTGAKSRWAAAVAALAVIPLPFFAGDAVGHIPQASLAGVLLVVALGMVSPARVLRMAKTARETRLLMLLTLVATLVLPLEWAILLGAGMGLLLHEMQTSVPRIHVLKPLGDRLVAMVSDDAPQTVVLEVSGNLHYAAIEPFRQRVEQLLPKTATTVVIDLTHAHDLRFAALAALEDISDELSRRGTRMLLAGVPDEFVTMLLNAKSKLHATPAETEPGLSVRKALNPTL